MKTITWASIGCGAVCEVKSLPAMYKLPHSRVAGVYSRSHDKAMSFVQRHGLPVVYSTLEDLLADSTVDIVYVATPPDTHEKYTTAALQAGKHVYVEKPMSIGYLGSIRMHDLAVSTGKKLFVAHYRRALPYFLKVRELVAQKKVIGKITTIRIEQFKFPSPQERAGNLPWRLRKDIAGGGHFFDLAPHAVDIVSFILGSEYDQVYGMPSNRGGLYEVEDTVVTCFSFKNGITGTGVWSFVASPSSVADRLVFVGSEGEVECSIFSFHPILLKRETGQTLFKPDRPEHIQMPLIASIIAELNGVGSCPSGSETALQTAWAMDRMVGKL